jgi:hypothetical protein
MAGETWPSGLPYFQVIRISRRADPVPWSGLPKNHFLRERSRIDA